MTTPTGTEKTASAKAKGPQKGSLERQNTFRKQLNTQKKHWPHPSPGQGSLSERSDFQCCQVVIRPVSCWCQRPRGRPGRPLPSAVDTSFRRGVRGDLVESYPWCQWRLWGTGAATPALPMSVGAECGTWGLPTSSSNKGTPSFLARWVLKEIT